MPDASREITDSRKGFFVAQPMIEVRQYEKIQLLSTNESSYSMVGNNSRRYERLTVSQSEKFLDEFDSYRAIYEKLQTERKRGLSVRLLDVGKQVSCGTRTWTRRDLDQIASWKGLPPPMLVMQRSGLDFERSLDNALRIEDESSRVNALCNIRGMGPILSSAVSMFTWPEIYGFMDYHTSNALRFLGFEFPRKHYTSRFTIHQLLMYLKVIRSLGKAKAVNAMEVAEALYALDRVGTRYD
jgi:hypothetical protein